jgi:dienelactone hydrolase
MVAGRVVAWVSCMAWMPRLKLMARLLALGAVYLAAAPAAAEIVSVGSTKSSGSNVANLKAELFKPKGPGRFPAVVLMHGCGGWQPAVLDALHTHAQRFLDKGYVVLNVDSFGPRGNSGGSVCQSDAALVKALKYRTRDAFDALHYLVSLDFVDPDNVFLMGQSNGGSVAINAAKAAGRPGFRAVAAYYPWCGSLGCSMVKLNAPLIIFSGGRDDWTLARECRNKASTGKHLKVVEYRNAAHSFDVGIPLQRYIGKLVGFDEAAAADSRDKMLAFFDDHVAGKVRQSGTGDQRQLLSHGAIGTGQASEPGNTGSRSASLSNPNPESVLNLQEQDSPDSLSSPVTP